MFKRDGQTILPTTGTTTPSRNRNIQIANETIDICRSGSYTWGEQRCDIRALLQAAVDGTIYHPAKEELPTAAIKSSRMEVKISGETTSQAAQRLLGEGKTNLVALNFANARTPGGAFREGASAQEEALCRASGLYFCLQPQTKYYNANLRCEGNYYTHGVIYSPRVPFFRDVENVLLPAPFELSIITAPAPNNMAGDLDPERTALLFRERIERVLRVAEMHGHTNLILGAWGCGAFGNDPTMVATAFCEVLAQRSYFEHICFAIYEPEPYKPKLSAFAGALDGLLNRESIND